MSTRFFYVFVQISLLKLNRLVCSCTAPPTCDAITRSFLHRVAPWWQRVLDCLLRLPLRRTLLHADIPHRISGGTFSGLPRWNAGARRSVGLIIDLPVGAWLAVPVFVRLDYELARYLAWPFLASTGLTELAHFIMPDLAGEP